MNDKPSEQPSEYRGSSLESPAENLDYASSGVDNLVSLEGGGNDEPTQVTNHLALQRRQRQRLITLSCAVAVLVGLTVLTLAHKKPDNQLALRTGEFNKTSVPLSNIPQLANSDSAASLRVSGQLQVANSVIVQPTAQPASPTVGQIYFDKTTKQLRYYNGTSFAPLGEQTTTITNNSFVTPGAAAPSVLLQASSPGTKQTGNINISGTATVDTLSVGSDATINGNFRAAALQGDGSALINLNASNLASGTVSSSLLSGAYAGITGVGTLNSLAVSGNANFSGTVSGADAVGNGDFVTLSQLNSAIGGAGGGVGSLNTLVGGLTLQGTGGQVSVSSNGTNTLTLALDSSVTLQGNSFNGVSQLVKLDSSGHLPALNGSALTNLNASNLASGTVPSSVVAGAYNNITGVGTLGSLNVTGSGAFGSTVSGANAVGNGDFVTLSQLTGAVGGITDVTALNSLSGGLTLQGTTGQLAVSSNGTDTLTLALDSSVTLQGNSFNGNSQLVKLDGSGHLPALNGSALTTLNASNLASGTVSSGVVSGSYGNITGVGTLGSISVTGTGTFGGTVSGADATSNNQFVTLSQLNSTVGGIGDVSSLNSLSGGLTLQGTSGHVSVSSNGTNTLTLDLDSSVTLQGNSFNGVSQLVKLDGSGHLPALNGSALTSLNASNLSSGTVSSGVVSGSYGNITGVGTLGSLSVTGSGSFGSTVSGANAVGNGDFVTLSQLNSAIGGVGGGVGSLNTLVGGLTLQGTSGHVSVASNGTNTLTLDLDSSVTLQGNSFNGVSQLVKLDGSGHLPALNGSALTNLNASNLATGTVGSGLLSGAYTGITQVGTLSGLGVTGNGSFSGTVSGADATSNNQYVTLSQLNGVVGGISAVTALNSLTGGLSLQGTSGQLSVSSNGTDTLTLALDSSVTLQGNSFNGVNQLVKLNGSGQLPALDASLLTSLNANNLASGTVASGRVSGAYTGITSVGTLGALSVTGTATLGAVTVTNDVGVGGNITASGTGAFTGTVSGANASASNQFVTLSQLSGAVGGVTPSLQAAYDNSTSPATIGLSSTNKGITIKDAGTSVGGNLFAVQNNAGTSKYLAVTTSGVSVAGAGSFTGTVSGADAVSSGDFVTLSQLSTAVGGVGGGVASVGTIDTGTYSDNGASISGTTIYLQAATAAHTGLVTHGTQTFGGDKTFANNVIVTGDLTAATLQGDGSGLTNLNASNLATGTVAGGLLSGAYTGITQVGTLSGLSVTGTGAFSSTVSGADAVSSNQFVTLSQLSGAIGGVGGVSSLNSLAGGLTLQGTSGHVSVASNGTNTLTLDLDSSVTLQGNSFNGVNQIVKLDGSAHLPALNASALTNLNASSLASGTVPTGVVSGAYGNITQVGTLSGLGVTGNGAFTGNVSGADATTSSQFVTLSQLTGAVGGITDVTALNSLTGGLTLQGTAGQVSVSSNGTDTLTLALDSAVTLQGNSFNGVNQLVKLDGSGHLPALNASALTNLNASNLATGTVSSGVVSGSYGNITGVGTLGSLSVTGTGVFGGTVSGADATTSSQFVTLSQLNTAIGGVGGGVSSLNSLSGGLTLQGTASHVSVSSNGTNTLTLDLDSSVTLQGNSFNGVNQLVKLNGSGILPALDGSLLTNLNGTNIASGTVADARLSGNVALYNATTPNFTGTLQHAGNNVCDASNNCGYLTGAVANGSYVQLQASTPGTAQTGHFNITGTGIAATLQAATIDTASGVALNIGTTNATSINLNKNVTVASGKTFTTNGSGFDASGKLGIGTTGPSYQLDVQGGDINVSGYYRQAGQVIIDTTHGTNSYFLFGAGISTTTGSSNLGAGNNSLKVISSGSSNIGVGNNTLQGDTTGNNNVGVGQNDFENNAVGSNNAAFGAFAGQSHHCAPVDGGVGCDVNGETLIGYKAGYLLQQGGDNNTLIGFQAGSNITTGTNNIIIGQNAVATSATASNQLNIGGLIYGDLAGGHLSVGNSSTSTYALNVTGDTNISGAYRVAGTSGATTTCSGGQLLQNQTIQGGIVTGGTCVSAPTGSFVTLQGSTPGTADTGNFNISGVGLATTLQGSTSVQTPLVDTASAVALNIGTTNATAINLNKNTTVASGKTFTVTSGATQLTGATSGDALTVNNSTSTGNIAVFKDNGVAVATLADGGGLTLQNSVDSASALLLKNVAGSTVLTVDTTLGQVGIGISSPLAPLDVGLQTGGTFTDGFESTTLPPFTTDGNVPFTVVSGSANTGSWSAKSGHPSPDSSPEYSNLYLTKTFATGGGTISFYKQLSDLAGYSYNFFIDGVLTDTTTTNNASYTLSSFPVTAGTHTFEWQYKTVVSPGGGFYIDDVTASNVLASPTSAIFRGNVSVGTTSSTNLLNVNALTTTDSLAQVAISTGAATNKGLIIQGVASQSANLLELQSSAGAALALFDAAGDLSTNGYVNAVNGFKYNGTAGATTSCSGGQLLQNQVVQGGIVTGGTCVSGSGGSYVTLQASTPGTADTGNINISGTAIASHLQGTTNVLTPLIDTASAGTLSVGTGTATNVTIGRSGQSITLNGDTTSNGNIVIAASKSLSLNGGNTASRPGSPTEGMLYYDTTTKQLLVYADGKWQADRTTALLVAASNSSQAEKDAADYVATGTSDQTIINSALTAASGGKVYLFEGTYSISASISIPNNTTLAGAGDGTLITIPNAQNGSYGAITNTTTGGSGTGITIQDIRLDGNQINQTSGTMYGIYLNGVGSGTTSTAVQGAKLTNIRSNNWHSGYGIYLATSTNTTITSSSAQGNSIGIYLSSSSNNIIDGNKTQGGAFGIELLNGSNNTITSNIAQSNVSYGIYLFASTNNTVANNFVQSNLGQGISLGTNANTNIISGNRLVDNGGGSTNNAILLDASDSNSITNNSITDSSAATTNYAINISNSTSDTNYLSNNTLGTGTINDAGTGTIYGGQLNGSSVYVVQEASGIQFTGPTTVTGSFTQTGGAVSLQGNAASVINTSSGNLSLDAAGTLQLGTGTTGAVTIGKNGITTTIQGSTSITPQTSTSTTLVCSNSGVLSSCDSSVLAPTATNFIQNQNSTTQTGTFKISGTGTAATVQIATAGSLDSSAAGAINIGLTSGGNGTSISLNQNVNLASGVTFTQTGAGTFSTGTGTISLNGNTILAAGKTISVTGDTYTNINAIGSPTEGMTTYDTTNKQLLTYQNGKWKASSQVAILVAASNSSQADKSAADYVATGAGDQAKINSALTAASGKMVLLLAGTYTINGNISVPNNTTLAGVGAGTVITIANGFNTNINAVTNTTTGGSGTGLTIRDLVLDGNSTNQSAGTMYGVYLNGAGSGTGSSAIPGAKITGLIVKNWYSGYGIYLTASSNSTIVGDTSENNSFANFELTSNSNNNTLSGNIAQGSTGYGFLVGTSTYNTLSGNTAQGNSSNGYYISTSSYTVVSGNTAQGNANAGISVSAGSNNTVNGNVSQGNAGFGIQLAGTTYNTVVGNNVANSGGATTNNGIYLALGSSNNTIDGNTITDSSATTTNYAINISDSGSTANYLSSNTFGSGSINDAGTSTIYGGQLSGSSVYTIQESSGIQLTGATTISGNLTQNTGSFSLSGNAGSTIATTSGTLGITGAGNVTLGTTAVAAGSSTVTIGTGNASAGTAGAITVDNGTSFSGTSQLNIGNANAGKINIGHGNITTAITGIATITNTNASTTLSVSSNTTPTTAVLVVNDTSGTTTDKLASLQAGGTPKFTVDAAGNVVALGSTQTAGLTVTNSGSLATQKGTDYATNGNAVDVNFGSASLYRLTGSALQTIESIGGTADGRHLTLVNAGTLTAVIKNQFTTGTTAADRIITGTGSDFSLPVDASVSLVYDAGSSRWRLIGSGSGGGSYINNGTSLQAANFNIQSTATGSITAELQGVAGQTANFLLIKDSTSANEFMIDNGGGVWVTPQTDSVNAFQILDSGNDTRFNVDTLHGNTVIGSASAAGNQTNLLTVAGFGYANNIAVVSDAGSINTFTVNQNGDTNIKTASNSATAFNIQSSTNVSLFSADTIHSQVIIGTGSATASPALLGLGNGNSTDPTGFAGAMYYNSSTGKFRCYTSAWADCGGYSALYASTADSTQLSGTTNSAQAFSTQYTMPANYCTAGKVIHVFASGWWASGSAPQQMSFEVDLGSANLGENLGSFIPVATSADPWDLDFTFTCRAAPSASSSIMGYGVMNWENANGTLNTQLLSPLSFNIGATAATNASQVLSIKATFQGTTNANNHATMLQMVVNSL